MLFTKQFYRAYGVLKYDRLANPDTYPVATLGLPRGAIYHHFPANNTSIGMDEKDPIFNQYSGKFVLMYHVRDYSMETPQGRFRKVLSNYAAEIMAFHRKHRFFRLTKDYTLALDNDRLMTVIDYSALSVIHEYYDSPLTPYHRWANAYQTLWATMAAIAEKATNQQYVIFDVPTISPAQADLIKYENDGITTTLLSRLNGDDKLNVADFWIWLGHSREKSGIHQIPEKHLDKINLVFVENGRWTTINLGLLNSWRLRDEDEGELNLDEFFKENRGIFTRQTAIDSLRLQRRTLRMYMSIREETKSVVEISDEEIEKEAETIERDAEGAPILKRVEVDTPLVRLQLAPTAKTLTASDDVDIAEEAPTEKVLTDEEIERDLEELDARAQIDESNVGLIYQKYKPPGTSLEAGVLEPSAELLQKGLITPPQFRRMEKLASRYKELPNPYGEGKFTDLLVIPKEELELPPVNKLAENIKGVNDDSFLASSLKEMNTRYVSKVLKKDLAKAVVHLQRGGFAVQSYDVTREETINDKFEIHTIHVQPAVGKPSTIRFRLPVVEEDGTFLAGGVRSRLRPQRGDIPIRKIGPGEVALTSYISKLFVSRSERMTFNMGAWLINRISEKAVDEEDTSITEARFGNCFRHDVKLPRLFSAISKGFIGFRAGDYVFHFNHKKQAETFTPELVERLKKTDLVELTLVGYKGTVPVGMDLNNQIFTIKLEGGKAILTAQGDLLSILGIEKNRMPVEMAEIGIFGKQIPVGFILAYAAGLGDLLETLDVPHRRVATRTHYKLEPDEFDVRFEDYTLIFKRTHLACMVFGGLNRYHRDIKRHSIYAFDNKQVYGSILANNDISVRSLRELDNTFKMWVDHITEELLIEMNEPTVFFDLLISAVKKLEFDDHPDVMSNLMMRDKGYERFAGLVYSELAKAMRVYSWKPQNDKASLDLNPQAVWQTLLADATVMQVEDSNPIANLQEKEVIVYRGEGGRTTRSMTAKTRGFHPTSLGVISEAGVDKGDVGTVVYTTADPSYSSLRGIISPVEKADKNAGRILSTSTLMSPGLTTDD